METSTQKPLLHYLSDFEDILKDYRPSEKTLELLANLHLVILAGPTAAGRNTLIKLLTQTDRYHYVVSDTTRKKRKNDNVMERDGAEYWFINEEEFLTGLKEGKYLEAAIIHQQQVSGVNITRLEDTMKTGKIAISEIENKGVATYHMYKPDTLCVFLLPPSFEKWMQRIRRRGDVDTAELRRRLESAVLEISDALKKDYYQFVINHEIHEAAQAVDEIANGRELDGEKQQLGRDHAEQLLVDVQLFLAAA
ncbi:MAG: guanylate kinase [Candidatus Saccharibacteria bacterium]|nr:guanylate kinase [Candidatus Saccharibacteria bacterium]